jgi:transcription initiation factor TFIIIB Brf1 subunit/transcription initiation factor TFIIB
MKNIKEEIENIILKHGNEAYDRGRHITESAGSDIYFRLVKELLTLFQQSIDTAVREERERIIETLEKMMKQSDSRSAELEVSEDGYVSGIEDVLSELKK